MHSSRKRRRRTVFGLVVFFLGGTLIGVLSRPRTGRAPMSPPAELESPAETRPSLARARRRRSFGARLAFASLFTAIFVGGAALTAFGGDQVAKLVEAESTGQAADATTDAATTDAATTDGATADAAPSDAAPAPEAAADPAAADPTSEPTATVSAPPAAPEVAPAAAPAGTPVPADEDPTAAAVVDATVDAGPAVRSGGASAKPRARTRARSKKRAAANANESPYAAPIVTIDARAEAEHVEHALHARKAAPDPEVHTPFSASIVWLNRALPDPTPPSKRLLRSFGRMLVHTSQAAGADWPLAYGILRAGGADGRVLASEETVQALAGRLAELKKDGRDDWQAAAAVLGDTSLADRAVALAHYSHAVGLETLIRGLDASKPRLTRRLLHDPRAWIYDSGRADLESGHVDVRVIAVISYLADTFESVTVTCLVSGHRLYARPGVVSRHIYGEAVDVAALGGVSVLGHQEPGSVTEKAVRALLLLPGETEPQQIISLLGLGGPSFPLSNHDDHIHVGY